MNQNIKSLEKSVKIDKNQVDVIGSVIMQPELESQQIRREKRLAVELENIERTSDHRFSVICALAGVAIGAVIGYFYPLDIVRSALICGLCGGLFGRTYKRVIARHRAVITSKRSLH